MFKEDMINFQKKAWDKIAYSYLKRSDVILDLGCGEGRFIFHDPDLIIGIDWNRTSLETCKDYGHNVIQGDVRVLPFANESVSGIHCSHLIEHFLPVDVHEIFSECNRVLKKNGILVIRSPLLWKQFYHDLTHIRPYNPEAIIHYLQPSKERTLQHINKNYMILALKWRYQALQIKNKWFYILFTFLNQWGFPWLKRNGYMLIMRKGGL